MAQKQLFGFPFYTDQMDVTNSQILSGGSYVTLSSVIGGSSTIVGNLSDYGAVADGSTSIHTAIVAAVAAGIKTIVIDKGSVPYVMSTGYTMPSGLSIIAGQGRPVIQFTSASTSRMFVLTSVTDCHLIGLDLDGSTCSVRSDAFIILNGTTADCSIRNCNLTSPPSASTGSIVISGTASRNVVSWCKIDGAYGTSVGISATSANYVVDNKIINGGGFGVRMGESATRNVVSRNYVNATAIESIALTFGCVFNRICDNHCEGTGDNGISISGDYNTVADNICYDNDKAGIGVWGAFNSITGNILLNNGQENAVPFWTTLTVVAAGLVVINSGRKYTTAAGGTTGATPPTHSSGTVSDGAVSWTAGAAITFWSGVWVAVGFGGTGQYNQIGNNTADDNQTIPSQYYCIRIEGSTGYSAWTTGVAITTGAYRTYGVNIYKATTTGTTGATPPTHTTGSVSDGAVTWQYINAFISSNAPRGCIVLGNTPGRNKGGTQYSDAAAWVANSLYGHGTFHVPTNAFGVHLANLPSSASGLATGQLWNNSGALSVA